MHRIICLLILLENINQLINAVAALSFRMELFAVLIQISSNLGEFFRTFVKICSNIFPDSQRFLKLLEYIRLLRFIGMKFQAEWSNSDVIQPFLYNRKGCHLFRHKQNSLPLSKRICNHCSNCLRFPGSWRSMKNKALSLDSLLNCKQLGSICRKRQIGILLFKMFRK